MSGFHEVGQAPCQWAWSFAVAGDQVGAVFVVIECPHRRQGAGPSRSRVRFGRGHFLMDELASSDTKLSRFSSRGGH